MKNLIKEKFDAMISNLKIRLHDIDFVATTADIWSSGRRSYLEVTIHWIDPKSLVRVSFAVSLLRLRGKHDYCLLAQSLNQIHERFNITEKVNFAKNYSFFNAYIYIIILNL